MDVEMELISLEEFMDIINKFDVVYIYKDIDSPITAYRHTKNTRSCANIIALKAGPSYYKFKKDNI